MITKLVHRIAAHRHPWRKMKFDELAEIYASMSMRSLGFGIIGIFVPVYLYQAGVSLSGVFMYLTLIFLFRIPYSFIAGRIVGRIGPKHAIAMSTILLIGFLCMLLSYDVLLWPLALLALTFTLANGLFFIAYHTDFSKVQHNNHGGKELGWLYIFERVGSALGPFVGGVVASLIAPEATVVLAIMVLVGSLIPLFLTNEPVKTHQHIRYKGFSNKKHARNFIAIGSFTVQNGVNQALWPLLLSVFIFEGDVFAKLGSVVALSMVISLLAARMFGKFIDSRKGNALLTYGSIMNVVLQVSRSIISTTGGAVAVSSLGEPINLSYRMPLVKGYYDEADSNEKQRIVYLVWGEVWSSVAKALFFVGVFVTAQFYDEIAVMRISIVVAGLVGLLMLVQRFPALKKV